MALVQFPTRNLVPSTTCFALPDPRIEPYQGQNSTSVIATQMETGRHRQRLRFTQEREMVNVVWFMSEFEYTYFKGWFANRISQGADSFILNMKLDIDFCDVECQFVGSYQYQFMETGWNVSAVLLVNNPFRLSESSICLIDAVGNNIQGMLDAIDNFHTLIHETIPISTPF